MACSCMCKGVWLTIKSSSNRCVLIKRNSWVFDIGWLLWVHLHWDSKGTGLNLGNLVVMKLWHAICRWREQRIAWPLSLTGEWCPWCLVSMSKPEWNSGTSWGRWLTDSSYLCGFSENFRHWKHNSRPNILGKCYACYLCLGDNIYECIWDNCSQLIGRLILSSCLFWNELINWVQLLCFISYILSA